MSTNYPELLESMMPTLPDHRKRAIEFVRVAVKEIESDLAALRAESLADRIPAHLRAEIAIRSDELLSSLDCLAEDFADGEEPSDLAADVGLMRALWHFPRYEELMVRSPSAAARIKGVGATLKAVLHVIESTQEVDE